MILNILLLKQFFFLLIVNSFECEFKDMDIFYWFGVDVLENNRFDDEKYIEEDFDEVVFMFSRLGFDVQLRLVLRKRFGKYENINSSIYIFYDYFYFYCYFQ